MIGYELRADFVGTVEQDGREVPKFAGATAGYGDGQTFDVGAALEADPHPGLIVVAEGNGQLVTALDQCLALKRTTDLPDEAQPISAYDGTPLNVLRADLKGRGIVGSSRVTREAAIRALVEHDERLANGDLTAQASDTHPLTADDEGLHAPEDGDQGGDGDQPATATTTPTPEA